MIVLAPVLLLGSLTAICSFIYHKRVSAVQSCANVLCVETICSEKATLVGSTSSVSLFRVHLKTGFEYENVYILEKNSIVLDIYIGDQAFEKNILSEFLDK